MKKTICVVDDTPDLLTNLAEFLRMEGFNVFAFGGGKEALHYLESGIPDLIITDFCMPPMNGFLLINEIRKNERLVGVPIIIFSAKSPLEYEVQAKELGVAHFIMKPADLDEILSAIYPFLNRKL